MTSRRLLSPMLVVLWNGLPVVAVAAIIRWSAEQPVVPGLIEGAVYLALFCGLALVRALQTLAASLGRGRRLVVRVLLTITMLAQLSGASTLYYPFTQWGMYSEASDVEECVSYRYRGIGPAGEDVPLAPQRLLGLRDPYLTWWIGRRLEKRRADGASPDPERDRELRAAVAGLGRLHNRRHPDRPVVAVEVLARREGFLARGRPACASPSFAAFPSSEPVMALELVNPDASARTLAGLRVLVFGVWLLKTAAVPQTPLAELPASLFDPPGATSLLPPAVWEALLSETGLRVLQGVTATAVLAALIGLGRNVAALAACALLAVNEAVPRGFGKMHHTDLVLLYAALVLSLFRSFDALAWPRPRRSAPAPAGTYSAPIVLVQLLFCLSYFQVAVCRLVYAEVSLFTPATMEYWLIWNTRLYDLWPWEWGVAVAAEPLGRGLLLVGFVAVTINELASPLAIVWRPFRRYFLVATVLFHLSSLALMKIFFWENCLLLAFFVDWDRRRRG